MNYLVKARARLDLKSHWRYIARDNLPAADRLLDAAEETFQLIAESPDIGSQRSFRKLVCVAISPVDFHLMLKVVVVRLVKGTV